MTRIISKALLISLTCLAGLSSQGQTAESTEVAVAQLALAGPAKRYCSGIWVSGREPAEVLENSVLLGAELVRLHESGEIIFTVDNELRIVAATQDRITARARHFGDQGCVILRPETDKPLFTPQSVVSALPEAASAPCRWAIDYLIRPFQMPSTSACSTRLPRSYSQMKRTGVPRFSFYTVVVS